MQDLDRVPGTDRIQAGPERVVVSRLDDHVRIGAVGHLLVGMEDGGLFAGEGGPPQAYGHPLGEESAVLGPRQEVPPAPSNHAVAPWHGLQHLLERAATGPPELVRIGVQNPVGAEFRRGEPRHARDPLALAHLVARLPDQMQDAGALVPFEDLRRSVLRAVVRGDDEVDPGMQVKRDLCVDDVRLVAHEERHDELHAARSQPGERCHGRQVANVRCTSDHPSKPRSSSSAWTRWTSARKS